MRRIFRITIVTLSCIACVWTQDQSSSSCSALLQQGIYDRFSLGTSSSGYSQFIADFCNAYSQYSNNQGSSSSESSSSTYSSSSQSSSNGGGLSGGILGWFGFGGNMQNSQGNSQSSGQSGSNAQSSYSQQISSLGQFLCSGTNNAQFTSNVLQEASEFIDPAAIDAYEQCLTQSAAGLQVSTTIREDQGQVTIQIGYVAPSGTPAQLVVSDIEISPEGSWECSGSLWALTQGKSNGVIGTNDVAMSCTRNVSDVSFTYQNQSLFSVSSSIVIITTAGTVIRNFVPIYATPPVDAITTLTQQVTDLQSIITSLQQEIASFKSSIPKYDAGTVLREPGDPDYSLLETAGTVGAQDCTFVKFHQTFTLTPTVAVSLYAFNADPPYISVFVLDAQVDGFTLCAQSSSAVWAYGVTWTASGV